MLDQSRKKMTQTAKSCLKHSKQLNSMYSRLQKDEAIKELIEVASGLDKELFHVASIKEDILLLHTHNATVATQLRMVAATIIDKVCKAFPWQYRFTSVVVQVRPMYQKQRSKQPALRRISEETAELLQDTAAHSNNAQLKAILLRISQHRK